MKVKKLLKKYSGSLDPKELDEILALALKKNLLYIYKNPDKEITVSGLRAFKKLLIKRQVGWSLAYLKGYKEFCGQKFLVSKYTLIPRPESELLVEEALKYLKDNHKILDIGTGSGCLILSILKQKQPNGLASDISKKALKTAKTNARKLGLKNKVKFYQSNLLTNIPAQKFDVILANLPYLTPSERQESSIKKEPTLALLSGKDGLDAYRQLLKQIPSYLEKKYLLLLEINPKQKEEIKRIINSSLPQAKIEFIKDLANKDRIVKIYS